MVDVSIKAKADRLVPVDFLDIENLLFIKLQANDINGNPTSVLQDTEIILYLIR